MRKNPKFKKTVLYVRGDTRRKKEGAAGGGGRFLGAVVNIGAVSTPGVKEIKSAERLLTRNANWHFYNRGG